MLKISNQKTKPILEMMAKEKELDLILSELNSLTDGIKEIKSDIKEVKSDISELKTIQAVLTNDNTWIKILFGSGFSIIIVFIGMAIDTTWRLLSLVS